MSYPRVVVAAMVPQLKGSMWMSRRVKSSWHFPGGFVEMGESWEGALCRILRRELNFYCSEKDFRLYTVKTSESTGHIIIFALFTNYYPGFDKSCELSEEIENLLPFTKYNAQSVELVTHREVLTTFLNHDF